MTGSAPAEEIEELTEKDEMEEYCFLHLRMKEGIPLDDFEHRYGHPLSFWYGRQVAMLKSRNCLQRRTVISSSPTMERLWEIMCLSSF